MSGPGRQLSDRVLAIRVTNRLVTRSENARALSGASAWFEVRDTLSRTLSRVE